MKKTVEKLVMICIYICVILYVMKFNILILFDLKLIFLVVLGTLMLTLTAYKRNSISEMAEYAAFNATIISYITTFLLVFMRLSGDKGYDNILYDTALNCRPLLYGLILNVLLRNEQNTAAVEEKKSDNKIEENNSLTNMKEFGLTGREEEIAILICEELSNKQIADRLFISETTVKKHSSNIYKKTGVGNREQLKNVLKNENYKE